MKIPPASVVPSSSSLRSPARRRILAASIATFLASFVVSGGVVFAQTAGGQGGPAFGTGGGAAGTGFSGASGGNGATDGTGFGSGGGGGAAGSGSGGIGGAGSGGGGGGGNGGTGGANGANAASITAGATGTNGTNGADGGGSAPFTGGGGGGGAGGYGYVVTGTGTITNPFTITAGTGGAGGSSGWVGGGSGGDGGVGIILTQTGVTLVNSGTITGGTGGNGGNSGSFGGSFFSSSSGFGGNGGAGVYGAGLTILNSGTISGGSGGTAGAGGNGSNGAAGFALDFTGGTNSLTTNAGGTLSGGIFIGSGGTLTLAQTAAAGATGSATYSNVISGPGAVTGSTDSGFSVTLSGANTYTGSTTVNQGTLNITGTSTGGGAFVIDGSGSVLTINSSGTVAASGLSFTGAGSETLNLNGGTFLVGAGGIFTPSTNTALVFNGGTLKSSAAFTISSDLPIAILSNSTIDTSGGSITSFSAFGNSASPGNLTIQGGNTLTGTFDSTMTGQIIVTGNTTLAMVSASTATGALSIASGSTLDLNNSSASFGGLSGAGSVINSTGAGVSTLTITGTGGNNFSGTISAATPADTAVTINLTSGTQIFSGANTYGGATTIQSGTLQLGIDNALPTGTTVTLNDPTGNSTALLDLNGHAQTIAGLTFIAPEGGSTVDLNGGVLTLAGNVNVVDNTSNPGNGGTSFIRDTAGGGALNLGGATRTFTIAGQSVNTDELEIDAVIQGTGGLVINATPSTFNSVESGIFLGAVNTYTGSTTVAQGRLTTTVAGALPSTTDLVLGTAGSALTGDVDLHGTNQTVNSLSLAAGNTGGTGNFITSNSGPATLTVSSTTTSSTFGGLITGPLSLVKAGAGTTLTLTAANTYTGSTTVQDGMLQDGIDNALPTTTTVTINGPTGNGTALLDLNGHAQTIAGLTFIAPEGGSTVDLNGGVLTLAGNVNLVDNTSQVGNGEGSVIRDTAGGGALDLGGATRTFTIAGQNVGTDELEIDAVIQGTGGVVINAAPSSTIHNEAGVFFGAVNTYTGSTTVAQGRLTTTVAGALPSTTDLVLGTAGSALTGDVNLDGTNQTVNSLSLATGNTGGTGNFITSNNGPATLTVSSTTTSSNFGGLITGPLSLVKDGSGTTLALTAANTYTGSTTIMDGTIQVGIDNALPTGTTVTLNNAAGTGYATLDLNGHNQTIAGLTIIAPQSGSVVDVNGGTLTLNGNVNLVNNTTAVGNGGEASIQDTAGGGALDLGGAVRTFNIAGQNVDNQELNVGATIQNGGVIINAVNSTTVHNSAGVNFTGANTYAGGTTINSGYLLANNTAGSATGTGAVVINSGGTLAGAGTVTGPVTLNSGGAIEAGQDGVGHGTQGTLHLGSVTWNGGGNVNLELGTTSDQLVLTGALTKGTAGANTITISNAGGISNQSAYTLATFASTTFLASDFTLTLPVGFTGTLSESSTNLDLTLAFAANGALISNSAGTPLIADFTVTGAGSTGTTTESNTINSLTMSNGSSLTIFNTLALTSGDVFQPGGSATISGGTLFGPNGLHFDVNGNLFIGSTLLGNATKTGTGALFLDGTLYGNMNVLQGLLGGNGTIFGNLFNAGTVSPGHSPGAILVSGNYTQTSTGALTIEIGGTDISQHDLLSVGGTAKLDGTLRLVRLNGFNLTRNQSVSFLTANGGVVGRFSMVVSDFTSDTILQQMVIYGNNSVALEAVQGSFAALSGLTPNQQAVGRALDSAAGNRRANAIFDYLDYRSLSKLPGDLDRISPEELTSVFTLGVALANVQSLNIQRRTDDIRSGSSGFNAANLALNGDGPSYSGGFGVAGPTGDDGKESKEGVPVAEFNNNRWGVFLSGTGEWVNVGDTNNARGYNLESGGFTLGVDYKVTPNLAIGLAAGYTGTTADLTDHGRIWVNGGKLGLYGTFYQNAPAAPAPTMSKDSSKEAPAPAPSVAKGLYADVAVFGGYNSYDTRRSALQGEARGSTDGGELNALFGTGYDFKAGGVTFGPTATFNYTYVGTSAFTEHDSLAPLDIHGGKGESLRTALGFKASCDWKCGGIVIKPELRAAWQHEYGDAAYALDANFANGAGNSFLVDGPKLGRDSVLLGAGFAIQCSERCSTYFYYDGELGRTNYQSNSVTGGFRYAF